MFFVLALDSEVCLFQCQCVLGSQGCLQAATARGAWRKAGRPAKGAMSASYCSRECQVLAFPGHKAECSAMKRMRAALGKAAAAKALARGPDSGAFVKCCHMPECGAKEEETDLFACKGCAEVRCTFYRFYFV